MHLLRKGGFRRLAVVVAVAGVGVLAVGAHAASAGVLEICKDSSNGMAGRTFTFTIAPTSGSSFTRDVKARLPDVQIVYGGVFPTYHYREILQ